MLLSKRFPRDFKTIRKTVSRITLWDKSRNSRHVCQSSHADIHPESVGREGGEAWTQGVSRPIGCVSHAWSWYLILRAVKTTELRSRTEILLFLKVPPHPTIIPSAGKKNRASTPLSSWIVLEKPFSVYKKNTARLIGINICGKKDGGGGERRNYDAFRMKRKNI